MDEISETSSYNYKKGIAAFIGTYLIWSFQPLYWNLFGELDTSVLMAGRILFAGLFCVLVLWAAGRLPELRSAFQSPAVMRRELPAAVFLAADWLVYLFAARNGRLLEISLGYYIMPLVVFLFGALLFKEPVQPAHFGALGLVIIGVILSVKGFGEAPWVTASLAVCFAVYSAIKKSLTVDSIVSTTVEILLMTPFALAYLLWSMGGGRAGANLPGEIWLLLAGGGLVTALPMLFYSIGIRWVPLTGFGLFEYLSPTFGLLCSRILGERLTREKLISFVFIWLGVLVYVLTIIRPREKKDKSESVER